MGLELARGFAQRGDVKLISVVLSHSDQGWLFDRMSQEQLRLEWIPCYKPPDLHVLSRLKDIVSKCAIDIIHTNGYRGNIYVRTLLDLKMLDLPTVVTTHGLPVLGSFRARVYGRLDRRPTRLANRIIAVDAFTMKQLVDKWRVSEERVRLIHNPAPAYFPPSPEEILALHNQLELESDNFIVLFLGRLEREKGLFELIAAHRRIYEKGRRFLLLIVGEGYSRAQLEEYAGMHPAGKYVKFLGAQILTATYLAICDVLILPSHQEGLPMVVLEAMVAGKPLIATLVGGIPDVVRDKQDGILIPPQNPNTIVQAIEFMMDNSTIALEMGRTAKERSARLFSVTDVVDAMAKVYQELV